MIADPNFGQPESARTEDVCVIERVDQDGAYGRLANRPAWSAMIPRSAFGTFELAAGDSVRFEIEPSGFVSGVSGPSDIRVRRHYRAVRVLEVERS